MLKTRGLRADTCSAALLPSTKNKYNTTTTITNNERTSSKSLDGNDVCWGEVRILFYAYLSTSSRYASTFVDRSTRSSTENKSARCWIPPLKRSPSKPACSCGSNVDSTFFIERQVVASIYQHRFLSTRPMPKCMLFVLGSTNVLHMFAVCAFKFLLPACFFWALRSFTS